MIKLSSKRYILPVFALAGPLLLSAGTLARFHVESGSGATIGDALVDLYDEDKPITVENFKRLVLSGSYSNMFLHRCETLFVVQGGGYANPFRTNAVPFTGYNPVPNFGFITNEYSVGRTFSNVYGTIAMARAPGVTNSATSQFYFNLGNNSFLDAVDGGFTVYGRTIGGFGVLNHFQTKVLELGIVDLTKSYGPAAGLFTRLPVTYWGTNAPLINQMYFCDISLLEVDPQLEADGSASFSWRTVEGMTNHIECSTNGIRGPWASVYQVLGTGSNLTVALTNQLAETLYYRIKIDAAP